MNIRTFSMAILISALPITAMAAAQKISLDKGDFIAAEKITKSGKSIVSVKLSKSGKAKFKRLNRHSVGEKVPSEVAGVKSNFEVKEPITGDRLEMGPYIEKEADRIIAEINR